MKSNRSSIPAGDEGKSFPFSIAAERRITHEG